jgi:hypothetical protein
MFASPLARCDNLGRLLRRKPNCRTSKGGGMSTSSAQTKLDAIFNAHMKAELAGDLDQTLATMAPNPHLVNVPTMVGGQGAHGVRTFYAKRLIGQFFPPDVTFETVSRTYGENGSSMSSSSRSRTPTRSTGCCPESSQPGNGSKRCLW